MLVVLDNFKFMAVKVTQIKKRPELLLDNYYDTKRDEITTFRIDGGDSGIKYMVVAPSEEYGRYMIHFHKSKEYNYDSIFTMKTDSDPTFNCQIGLIGGVEELFDTWNISVQEIYSIIYTISKNFIGKNLILIDIDQGYKTELNKYGFVIHEVLDYVSSNNSERMFVLINKPV